MKNFIYKGTQPYSSTFRVVKDGKPAFMDVKMSLGDVITVDETIEPIKVLVRNGLLEETKNNPTIKTPEAVIPAIKKETAQDTKDIKSPEVKNVTADVKSSTSQNKSEE